MSAYRRASYTGSLFMETLPTKKQELRRLRTFRKNLASIELAHKTVRFVGTSRVRSKYGYKPEPRVFVRHLPTEKPCASSLPSS